MPNVVTALRERRSIKKQEALDQAALRITDDAARNETELLNVLRSVDYYGSQLPPSQLEHRMNDSSLHGESFRSYLIYLIEMHPLTIGQDTTELDGRLLALAISYADAVEAGFVETARMARGGLLRGVKDIRGRLQNMQPSLVPGYVKRAAEYIDRWLTVVAAAVQYDQEGKFLEIQRTDYERACGDLQTLQGDLTDRILTPDSEESLACAAIMNRDLPADRLRWSSTQHRMHQKLVELAMRQTVLDVQGTKLYQTETAHSANKGMLETLYTSVADVSLEEDPDLTKKKTQQIEELFRELEAYDEQIYGMLSMFEAYEDRAEQAGAGTGTASSQRTARNEIDRLVSDAVQQQKSQLNGQNNTDQSINQSSKTNFV